MFAVPGWAVSASALVNEDQSSKRVRKADGVKNLKKRKRNDDWNSQPVAVDRLFSGHAPDADRSLKNKSSEQNQDRERRRDTAIDDLDEAGDLQMVDKKQILTQKKDHIGTKDVGRDPNSQLLGPENRRLRKKQRKQLEKEHSEGLSIPVTPHAQPVLHTTQSVASAPATKLTPLQAKMRNKLTSARFRHLNETLYTTSSSEALTLFTNSPELFADYHLGFSQQVKDSWPQNPVEGYVKAIKARGLLSEPSKGVIPLPRRKTGSCTVADLGCGDAPLARGCQANIKSLQLKFHNYDLYSPSTIVTKADISNLPLRDGEADVAVFCLSLMGTNWVSFVEEAWRILRGDGKGEAWVAEVKSRFGRITRGRVVDNSVGKRRKISKPRREGEKEELDGPEQFVEDARIPEQPDDETDISTFIKVFTRRGFQLREGSVNKSNKMFVSMVFTKSGIPTAGKYKGLKWNGKEYTKQQDAKMKFASGPKKDDEEISIEEEAKALKPCVYKVR